MVYKARKKHILIFILSVAAALCVALSAGALLSEDTSTVSIYKQFRNGNIAVADFSVSNGMTVYSGNGVRSEFYTDYGTVYQYNTAQTDYPRSNSKDGLCISGTYDNSTVIFYVKEADTEVHALQVVTKAIDEAYFFAGIKSEKTASSVSMAVYDGETIKWRTVIDAASDDEITTELYYGDCPFDEKQNAYMIALRVDSGMTCFNSLKLTGLEVIELNDCKNDIYYDNGTLMQGTPDGANTTAAETAHFNYILLSEITSSEMREDEIEIDFSAITKLMQRISEFIIKVTEFLSKFFG